MLGVIPHPGSSHRHSATMATAAMALPPSHAYPARRILCRDEGLGWGCLGDRLHEAQALGSLSELEPCLAGSSSIASHALSPAPSSSGLGRASLLGCSASRCQDNSDQKRSAESCSTVQVHSFPVAAEQQRALGLGPSYVPAPAEPKPEVSRAEHLMCSGPHAGRDSGIRRRKIVSPCQPGLFCIPEPEEAMPVSGILVP